MGILQLLAKENYITYHKEIARSIGVDEAILFGELCSMSNLYGNEFFCEQSRLVNDTCLTEYRIRNALKKLQSENLVSVSKKGIPAKNYYVLNENRLLEILDYRSTCSIKFNTTGDSNFNITGNDNFNGTCDIESDSTINKNTVIKNTSKNEIRKNTYNSTSDDVRQPDPQGDGKKIIKKDIDNFFETIWKMYPRKLGKGQVSASKKKELYNIGIDEMTRAIDRFKDDMEKNRTEINFYPYGSTFFNSRYIDYLDNNYEPQAAKANKSDDKPKGYGIWDPSEIDDIF